MLKQGLLENIRSFCSLLVVLNKQTVISVRRRHKEVPALKKIRIYVPFSIVIKSFLPCFEGICKNCDRCEVKYKTRKCDKKKRYFKRGPDTLRYRF